MTRPVRWATAHTQCGRTIANFISRPWHFIKHKQLSKSGSAEEASNAVEPHPNPEKTREALHRPRTQPRRVTMFIAESRSSASSINVDINALERKDAYRHFNLLTTRARTGAERWPCAV